MFLRTPPLLPPFRNEETCKSNAEFRFVPRTVERRFESRIIRHRFQVLRDRSRFPRHISNLDGLPERRIRRAVDLPMNDVESFESRKYRVGLERVGNRGMDRGRDTDHRTAER